MEYFGQVVTALAVCAAVAAVIWSVKGAFLTPVERRADADVFLVIRVRNDGEGLERAMRGIRWLRDSGRMDMCVVISDDGLTREARRRAGIIAERNGAVLCRTEELIARTERLRRTD